MFNNVKIGDRIVPMLAMASADVYYKNVFHEDPLKAQTVSTDDVGGLINFHMRMAFIMAKYAELHDRKEMAKLNEDSYLDWLDQFDRMDLMNALEDVMMTYNGQMLTSSEAKKNNEEPSDK